MLVMWVGVCAVRPVRMSDVIFVAAGGITRLFSNKFHYLFKNTVGADGDSVVQ